MNRPHSHRPLFRRTSPSPPCGCGSRGYRAPGGWSWRRDRRLRCRSHQVRWDERGQAVQETHEAMTRPTLEVGDIIRTSGNSFWDRPGSQYAWQHRKVTDAIVRCRTAALCGHRDRCSGCGHQAISYNSCRNRHCPRCQGNARARWLAAFSRAVARALPPHRLHSSA